MLQYKGLYNQSIYDVCLNTYGTFDYLIKLAQDNKINSINTNDAAGIIFIFDESLVKDRLLFDTNNYDNIRYSTYSSIAAIKLTEENGIKYTEEGGIKISE